MTAFSEYTRYDGLGLAELVRKGEVTPAELVASAQAAIAAVDPKLNAVVLDMAAEAEATLRAGVPRGPFAGVPFVLKDFVVNYAGVPTRFGSRLFEGVVPDHDSEIMTRFRRAGVVTIAKTSCPEMGFNANSEAVAYGMPTRNPWDPSRIASGSSGGSAVAVAARIVPLAYGDDGGGSIRLPASHNGLFGLKPTRGRVPLGPDVPDSAFGGLPVQHVLTRSVRDSAAMLDAIAGPDPGATYFATPSGRSFLSEVGASPGRLRIAWTASLSDDVDVHRDCRAAVEDAARLCEELGHTVTEAKLTLDRAGFARAWCTVLAAWLAVFVDGTAAALGRTPGLDNLETATWSAVQYGRAQKSGELIGALMFFNALSRTVGRFFVDHDVLLTPTVSQPPWPSGSMNQNEPGIDAYEFIDRRLFTLGHTCAFFNATGNPAMSVPLHWNGEGLPIGAHFVGRYGDEATLFRLAAELETARPWAERRPPICAS